jgi:dUTPase
LAINFWASAGDERAGPNEFIVLFLLAAGLIVATAVVVHPGFAGPITLELRNLGEVPLAIYPLERIAQLTFHELDEPVTAEPQFVDVTAQL